MPPCLGGRLIAAAGCTQQRDAAAQGDEWEEKWGEHYWSMGKAHKYADKWGKEGVNVWHERWGEDYDGVGGCTKWTDKARAPATPPAPGRRAARPDARAR